MILELLHQALTVEFSVLHVNGTDGIGFLVAILSAICSDNVVVSVNNEAIFNGLGTEKVRVSIAGSHYSNVPESTQIPVKPETANRGAYLNMKAHGVIS